MAPTRFPSSLLAAYVAVSALALGACSSDGGPAGDDDSSVVIGNGDPADVPIAATPAVWLTEFNRGDELFDLALRDADGLGPLYTRVACSGCHDCAARGPGVVQKMSVVEADGITPAADQSALPFGHTVHALMTAGATHAILPPAGMPNVKVSTRVGPPVFGRGYMEAILDSEIERMASEEATRTDGIHGRVNHVIYASEANPDTRFHTHQKGDMVIGRFGLKARVATLDDFAADALAGDMGITSPLRPVEFANPDGLTDDDKPGIDVTIDSVNGRANYTRLLSIPRRKPNDAGAALFAQVHCDGCHVPSLHTRTDYPIPMLANIDAPVYSDLLLHDLGDALADGMQGSDGEAGPRDWRTAPLMGLRFDTTYLHDGRAKTVRAAVLAHDSPGSEAHDSLVRFLALTTDQQQTLLDFVGAL